MTQQEFDEMPALMRPWMARRVLNVSSEQLRYLREVQPKMAIKLRGMEEWRYHKSVIAGMTRLKMK